MSNISELVRVPLVEGCKFGLEIEMEGQNLTENVTKEWAIDYNEGSLRDGGLEYIMRKPLPLNETLSALVNLNDSQAKAGARVNFSQRTSVHVHMNVSDLSMCHLFNLITLSFMFERALGKFCGEDREGNTFCLRGCDAEDVYDSFFNLCQDKEFNSLNNDNIRYSFVNMAAIPKYGSLEFRGMRGTSDVVILRRWLSALSDLRELSQEFDNPKQLLDQMNVEGVREFFVSRGILTRDLDYRGCVNHLRETFNILYTDILHVDNWEMPEPPVNIFTQALEDLAA